MKSMKGEAFANPNSFSEGFLDQSTGVPYFFVSDLDQSMVDIKAHNFTSFSLSEAQTKYCEVSFKTKKNMRIKICLGK